MNKLILLLCSCLFAQHFVLAQAGQLNINQTDNKVSVYYVGNNYSTSFTERNPKDSTPFIVSAIPYSGKYQVSEENAPLDVSPSNSEYRYQSPLLDNYRELNTYDSGNVYFYVPYVHPGNASKYEYRILLNGKTELTPWSNITAFTNDTFQLYVFKKHFAYIGGYHTTWGNTVVAELRKKGDAKIISAAEVYWKQIKPVLLNIYTTNELNEFLLRMKESYKLSLSEKEIKKWQSRYPANEIDTITHLPKKLVLQPTENNIIFYLKADIYKRDALEYQVVQDGKVITDWKPNDFDNNIIWLNNLPPGSFILRMRFSGQRHNVAEYPFEIRPAWHQTALFKIIAGGLIAVFFCFIIVLFVLRRQRGKTVQEQLKKQKLQLELKAIYAQLNPHFVFNALTSIQGLVNTNNLPGANRYLAKFASLMRGSLEASDKSLNSLDKEVAMLETYLSLEQLRFGFKYKIQVGDNINTSATSMPPLLLQPLVENAVKHGVATMGQQGMIDIRFEKQGNDMVVTIADNGGGYNSSTETGNGYGLKLTRERISLLNDALQGQPVSMAIESAQGKGTTVHLQCKNWWI